jgi:hypothetical protein
MSYGRVFWQEVVDAGYAPPAGESVERLTDELLELLGSPDPFLRDTVGYSTLARWIRDDRYPPPVLERLAARLTDGLSADALRSSFSALTLTDLVSHSNNHARPFLAETTVRRVFEAALSYLAGLREFRGYDADSGWISAYTHAADLLWVLAENRHLGADDLERLMDAVAAKVVEPRVEVARHDEDEHFARAVMMVLHRELLPPSYLDTWLDRFTCSAEGEPWLSAFRDPAACGARQNTKQFLRSLYFQLVQPGFGELRYVALLSADGRALAPRVMAALHRIAAWC